MSVRSEAAPQWRPFLAAVGLGEPAAFLQAKTNPAVLPGQWVPLTKPGLGGRERWRVRSSNGGPPVEAFVKVYRHTPWREQVDRIRRQTPLRSRSYWEYQTARALAKAGVNAPPAVAWVESMRGCWEHCSLLVLGQVAGDALDRTWTRLTAQAHPMIRQPRRRGLVEELARFVAAFHRTGFCHRDLYLCHVFADLATEGEAAARFALIDLARVHRPTWRRTRWLIKDLSQLDASARQVGARRSDRLRFLRTYLAERAQSQDLRPLSRRIVAKSDWILRRIARKSRT